MDWPKIRCVNIGLHVTILMASFKDTAPAWNPDLFKIRDFDYMMVLAASTWNIMDNLGSMLEEHIMDWPKIYQLCRYRKASSTGAYGHDPFLKCFWRASTWFHNNRYYNSTIYIIDNVIVLSDLVQSRGYSSKSLQKGSCPYAPVGEAIYGMKCESPNGTSWKDTTTTWKPDLNSTS